MMRRAAPSIPRMELAPAGKHDDRGDTSPAGEPQEAVDQRGARHAGGRFEIPQAV
jgi:hypothetical protein